LMQICCIVRVEITSIKCISEADSNKKQINRTMALQKQLNNKENCCGNHS
jgi:hypothetical protein